MILDTIVDKKKEEVALLKQQGIHLPRAFSERAIAPPRGFRQALLTYPGVSIIAEAKKASPSKGVICTDFDVTKIVAHYEKNDAQAISVLTDVDFFQGSLVYLLEARETVMLPVLRKDFIIDEIQIEEASIFGADAILLIAAILDEKQIHDYFIYAKELHMDVLVEVHNEAELEKSLRTDCDLIGVNNRNLNDFTVDIETTFRLKKLVPDTIPLVSESGLKSGHDIDRLRRHGIAAALIGETLMRAGTDGTTMQSLRRRP
jgi:indole-3-glycerol phosphate synthase